MAVRIRLQRIGKKHQPSYRIVVADSRWKRNGNIIEKVGFYNPLTDPATVKFDKERIDYWLSVGAQMSDVVRELVFGQKRKRTKVRKKTKKQQGKEA